MVIQIVSSISIKYPKNNLSPILKCKLLSTDVYENNRKLYELKLTLNDINFYVSSDVSKIIFTLPRNSLITGTYIHENRQGSFEAITSEMTTLSTRIMTIDYYFQHNQEANYIDIISNVIIPIYNITFTKSLYEDEVGKTVFKNSGHYGMYEKISNYEKYNKYLVKLETYDKTQDELHNMVKHYSLSYTLDVLQENGVIFGIYITGIRTVSRPGGNNPAYREILQQIRNPVKQIKKKENEEEEEDNECPRHPIKYPIQINPPQIIGPCKCDTQL